MLGKLEMDADCIDSELQCQQKGAVTNTARESVDCVRAMLPRTRRITFW
jgi:hypothetical protein